MAATITKVAQECSIVMCGNNMLVQNVYCLLSHHSSNILMHFKPEGNGIYLHSPLNIARNDKKACEHRFARLKTGRVKVQMLTNKY